MFKKPNPELNIARNALLNFAHLTRGGECWNGVPRRVLLSSNADQLFFFGPKGIKQAIKNRLQKL